MAEPQTETVTDPPTETGLPEEQPQDPSPVLGEEEGKIEFGDPDDDEEVSVIVNSAGFGVAVLYVCNYV